METLTEVRISVVAFDATDMSRQLEEAVATAKTAAIREQSRGILVTRHDFYTYTVELSSSVPFGFTEEACLIDYARPELDHNATRIGQPCGY